MAQDKGHDVFISYSHNDIKATEAICTKLESNGISCWYAPRNISPGTEWATAIMEALKKCKIMVLVFTDDSNASIQVRREVDNAISSGKTVIPFKLTENLPSGGMEYYLSTLHWLDAMYKPMNKATDELSEMVQGILSGKLKLNTPQVSKPKNIKKPIKQILRSAGGIVLLLFAVVCYIVFWAHPSMINTTQVWVLLFGLLFTIVGVYRIISPMLQKRIKHPALICLAVCVLLTGAVVAYSLKLESRAPSVIAISDKGPQASMNMMNYTMGTLDDNGNLYYVNTVNDRPGIYKVSMEGFLAGENGEEIVTNVDADNLALTQDDRLIFRDHSRSKYSMKYVDLNTGTVKKLMDGTTAYFYSFRDYLLFLNVNGSGIDFVSSNGDYEQEIVGEAPCDYLCVYKGVPYFIGQNGVLKYYNDGGVYTLTGKINSYYIIYDDCFYYIDENNTSIYRMEMSNSTGEKICGESPYGMVVYGDYLYFLNNYDDCAVYRVPVTGGDSERISTDSGYTAINIFENCLYLCKGTKGYDRIMLDE